MKKLFAIALMAFTATVFMFPSSKVDAQPTHSLQCCDGNNVIRCRLGNWTPLGNPCFCPNQGWGHAC